MRSLPFSIGNVFACDEGGPLRLRFAQSAPSNGEHGGGGGGEECHPRGRPLILAYHAVSSTWASPLAVSAAALDEQAAHMRRHGYEGLTFAEAERRRVEGTLPSRSVVFTFDDGYASTLRAAETLARHGYPGTVFVVTRFASPASP